MIQLRSIAIFILLLITPVVEAATNPSPREVAAMESRLVSLVNGERAKYHLPPLSIWNVLSRHAKKHTQNMATGRVSQGHGGFEKRSEAVFKEGWVESFGENVASCYLMADPLQAAVDGWMKSHKHRINILGDYTETGIAIAYNREGRCYMTQLFAKRK